MSRFVFWVTWLGFILLSVSVLGILGLQEQIADFLPILAAPIRSHVHPVFWTVGSQFLFARYPLAAVNANVPSPRVLSLAVRSIIIVFVLSIVFEELALPKRRCWWRLELSSER